ncbi:MAG TPA: class I SAM-dependent methyltransferase [Nitrospirota bacterium]|nr:class I SAM-dependent methyltransferase [Nitrospirota bacterium]
MQKKKNQNYYNYQRRDLIGMLPSAHARYLEIGCGNGATLEYLKAKGAAYVAGVDINAKAIAVAETKGLDAAFVADIEKDDLPFEKNYFDCIILADVLEHLYNPWDAVRKIRSYLRVDGDMLISIPNVKYYKLLQRLILHDEWKYAEQGILDNTHVRFFTRREIVSLIEGAGLKTEKVQGVYISGKVFRLINGLLLNRLRSFAAYQFYILAKNVPYL